MKPAMAPRVARPADLAHFASLVASRRKRSTARVDVEGAANERQSWSPQPLVCPGRERAEE